MNRKILFQVTAPAILVGLLLAGTCLVSAWYIQHLQRKLSRFLSQNVASLEAALELENTVRQLRYHSLLYLARPADSSLDLIRQDEQTFELALEKARLAANTPQEAEDVEKIARGYEQYRGEMAKLRDRAKRHGPITDLRLLTSTNPIQHVTEPCEDLYRSSQEQLKASSQDTERATSQAQLALLFLGLGGPLGGGLIGYGIVRGLTRTIAQLSVRVQDVVQRLNGPPGPARAPERNGSGGALIDVAQVTVSPDDDLGVLDRQMQHVVQRVEEVTQRLQRQHWEMLRAEQLAALGKLAAGVAHEVRNPLTGMKLLVEAALRPGKRKPLSEEDLEVIHGEITRLEETVGNFLAFARLPAPQRQVCDLREALARPLDLVRARARQQQVKLTVEAPDRPLPVSLDAGQFGTVLVNLFLNALDVMPRGGELRVELEDDGRECRLRVRDSGPGIAPEVAGRLFTPFTSTKPTGTGLGLSLSRRIVEEHGGTITADNHPEGGACFTITLPRAVVLPPGGGRPTHPGGRALCWGGSPTPRLPPPRRFCDPRLNEDEITMPTLLVIDDEQSVRYSFRRVFEGDGVSVLTAATGAEGLEQVRAARPDVVVLDLQLPDASGLDVFRDLKALGPRRPVIFITAHGTTETAIEAMKQGAFDYLVKPVDLEKMSALLGRAFEAARLMNEPAVLPAEERGDRIVGRSPAMQEMCKLIGRLAPQDVNVLILGESGAGKELVARALYQHSRRADKPFLAINCAALPEALLESELFGHEQGAFTGAHRRRIGKFEQCDGGTLFLDEIGDMSAPLQAKMLRVLQDQRFERLGSNETLQTQVRVLAATNKDLEAEVTAGRFRKDLYYRLKVVTLAVPPLRTRPEDVSELAHYFLFRFNRELNLDLRGISPEALELLQAYPWPGNVRELQSVLKQAMLHATGRLLLPEFLPPELRQANGSPAPAAAPGPDSDLEALIETALRESEGKVYDRVIESVERVLLTRVLRQTHGHQARASDLLGLNRATLRAKLRALGLAVDKVLVEEPGDRPADGPLPNP